MENVVEQTVAPEVVLPVTEGTALLTPEQAPGIFFHADKRTFAIKSNVMAYAGQEAIRDYLRRQYPYNHLPYDWEWRWDWSWEVTGKGEYTGTLPKRLSKYYYKTWAIKLTPENLNKIGDLAAQHGCGRLHTYLLDFDTEFRWRSGEFGDAYSCYFTGAKSTPEMLRRMGAHALRFYDPDNPERGIGRTLLLPIPDHNDAVIITNAFGHDMGIQADVLAAYWKLSQRHISWVNYDPDNSGLYQYETDLYSSNDARVIGPEASIAELPNSITYHVGEPGYPCAICGKDVSRRGDKQVNDKHYHVRCWDANLYQCSACYGVYPRGDQIEVPHYGTYCPRCAKERYFTCEVCGKNTDSRYKCIVKVGDQEKTVCGNCQRYRFAYCADCGGQFDRLEVTMHTHYKNGNTYCPACYDKQWFHCDMCHKDRAKINHKPRYVNGQTLCWKCEKEILEQHAARQAEQQAQPQN